MAGSNGPGGGSPGACGVNDWVGAGLRRRLRVLRRLRNRVLVLRQMAPRESAWEPAMLTRVQVLQRAMKLAWVVCTQ